MVEDKLAEVWRIVGSGPGIDTMMKMVLPMTSLLEVLACLGSDRPYPRTNVPEGGWDPILHDLIWVGFAKSVNGKLTPTESGEKAIAVFFGDRKKQGKR